MTPALLKSVKNKDKLYHKCLGKDKNSHAYNKYIQYRNNFNRIKTIMKQNYYKEILNQYRNDSRKIWSTLNTLIGKTRNKNDISDMFKIDGKCYTDPDFISNKFCEYFTNIGAKFASMIESPNTPYQTYLKNKSQPSFFMEPTDPGEVQQIITSLKPKNSAGHDNISSKVLKYLKTSISIPISHIINKSLISGKVPQNLKLAKIIPIYKAKEKTSMNNYRPISLLPSVSKLLEKIVHYRLYKFLKKQNILYSRQYGFRPSHSTSDAVTTFVADIMTSLEDGKYSTAVLLDLSKAFDTIDHNILLRKMHFYGVRGVALEWFKSYLSDRSQYVAYRDTHSKYYRVTCGVPQGSVLGPLLFIIYTNDLPNSLANSKSILFADDTTIYNSSSDIQSLITSTEIDLLKVADWFRANKLSLNVSKTNFVMFCPKRKSKFHEINTIKLGDEIIQRVNNAKFLGMHIDDELLWHTHISHVSRKLSSGIYLLNAVKRTLTIPNMKQLYYSLIHPHLTYGVTLWGSAFKYELNKIIKAQKKAIRNICKAQYNEHTDPLFKKLQIPKLTDLYKIQVSNFMFKYTTGTLPHPLLHLFTSNTAIHIHDTRHQHDPVSRASVSRSDLMTRSILYQGPKIWFETPSHIKNSTSFNSFKRKIKQHQIQ